MRRFSKWYSAVSWNAGFYYIIIIIKYFCLEKVDSFSRCNFEFFMQVAFSVFDNSIFYLPDFLDLKYAFFSFSLFKRIRTSSEIQ